MKSSSEMRLHICSHHSHPRATSWVARVDWHDQWPFWSISRMPVLFLYSKTEMYACSADSYFATTSLTLMEPLRTYHHCGVTLPGSMTGLAPGKCPSLYTDEST